jgi:hypothetical protein
MRWIEVKASHVPLINLRISSLLPSLQLLCLLAEPENPAAARANETVRRAIAPHGVID